MNAWSDAFDAPGRHRAVPLRRVGTGDRIMLERNPDYWGKLPRARALIFRASRTPASASSRSRGAPSTSPTNPRPRAAVRRRSTPTLAAARCAGNNVAYLAMNTTRPPFDDVGVRRAVNSRSTRTRSSSSSTRGMAGRRPAAAADACGATHGGQRLPLRSRRGAQRTAREAGSRVPLRRPVLAVRHDDAAPVHARTRRGRARDPAQT